MKRLLDTYPATIRLGIVVVAYAALIAAQAKWHWMFWVTLVLTVVVVLGWALHEDRKRRPS